MITRHDIELLDAGIIAAGIVDETPAASWSRSRGMTTCLVTLYLRDVRVGEGSDTVLGCSAASEAERALPTYSADADERAYLAALGQALRSLAGGLA